MKYVYFEVYSEASLIINELHAFITENVSPCTITLVDTTGQDLRSILSIMPTF